MKVQPERILFVSGNDFRSPGTKIIYHFANALALLSHKVMLFMVGDPESVREMDGQPLFDIRRITFRGQSLSGCVLDEVRRFEPDVIHAWTARNVQARVSCRLKRQFDAKLVIHFEDNEQARFWRHLDYVGAKYNLPSWINPLLRPVQFARLFQKSLLHPLRWDAEYPLISAKAKRVADAFIVWKPLEDLLRNQYPRKPIFVVYPGADLDRFRPDLDGTEIRTSLNLVDKQVIMYTGVVTLAAFNTVLDAFVEVANRFPKAVFVYVGDSVSRTEVARSIGSNGLEGKVLLTGSVEHRVIHKYMAAADILFQLSLGEEIDEYRFPTKIPEYFAMGKPVITFAHGAGRIFEDGVHVLKHDGTPGEIARQIAILLTNPELRQRLGANARRKAEELFDWKKNVQHLSNVYAEVIAT